MTSRPRSLFRRVALLAAIAMIAASCGLSRSEGGVAATVTLPDGTQQELSFDTLDEYHDTMADDIDFVAGAFNGTIPPGFRSSIVNEMILDAVLDHLLEENGVTVNPDSAEAARIELAAAISGFFPVDDAPLETAQARFDTLPYLPFLASLQAKQVSLGDALAEAAGGGEVIEVPCSSHILLDTEDEANDVIALLDDGGDFAELAMEFSTGPTGPAGGDLGCSDPNGFVPEFRDAIVGAPVDTIIGPVQTQFGFHVITVTATEEQTINAPDPVSLAGGEIVAAISQIEVDLDPSLGEWNQASGSVTPPG